MTDYSLAQRLTLHRIAVSFGILDDDRIRRYFELGCEVKALGRGHIQRIKEKSEAKK